MIFRNLHRCPAEDIHHALAASCQGLLRRAVIVEPASIDAADVDYLLAHPDFDPSLSYLAYDAGQPVAFLASRIEPGDGGPEAVWCLFGGREDVPRAREMLLDEAMDNWRKQGACRARQGRVGMLGSLPRLVHDADVVELLSERGFDVETQSVLLAITLAKLAPPEGLAERERELRQRGYAVRPASPDEVTIVACQFPPRHTGTMTQELWNLFARHLRDDALMVGEFHRQLCGYAGYYGWTLPDERPALAPAFVEEVHRHSGLSALLRHHALRAAKQAGKSGVQVFCAAGATQPYEKAGFAPETRFVSEAVADLS